MLEKYYRDKSVLVLGGTGFIGSNLVLALDKLGAKITVISRGEIALVPQWPSQAQVINLDLSSANPSSLHQLYGVVNGSAIIFDLAGRSGAVSSTQGPYDDLQANVVGQYNILDTLRIANPSAHIIFLSSRLVYGKAISLPVSEAHPTEPTSFYGINKLAAEKYHRLFYDLYGIKTTILRVTVPYGPYRPARQFRHGIINLFLERAFRGENITIYGDGSQLRDIIFIDDLIAALLTIPTLDKTIGKIYNLGCGKGISLREIASAICELVGKGEIRYIEWPEDARKVETGDFYCSIDKLVADIDWLPRHSLSEGIQKCGDFYCS